MILHILCIALHINPTNQYRTSAHLGVQIRNSAVFVFLRFNLCPEAMSVWLCWWVGARTRAHGSNIYIYISRYFLWCALFYTQRLHIVMVTLNSNLESISAKSLRVHCIRMLRYRIGQIGRWTEILLDENGELCDYSCWSIYVRETVWQVAFVCSLKKKAPKQPAPDR